MHPLLPAANRASSANASSTRGVSNTADVANSADVASTYDRWAPTYDQDVNRTRDLDAVTLREHGPRVRGRMVLELGCGTGKNSAWVAPQCLQLTGMDISLGMLSRARSRVPADNARFVHHDIRNAWPVPDGSVDVVLANLVLEHIEDLGPIFAECARVLRTGGKLYCSELHPARQQRGGQAHFFDTQSGVLVYVPAFRHTVADYLNTALSAGFRLRAVGEWVEDEAASHVADGLTPPRLFTARFVREA